MNYIEILSILEMWWFDHHISPWRFDLSSSPFNTVTECIWMRKKTYDSVLHYCYAIHQKKNTNTHTRSLSLSLPLFLSSRPLVCLPNTFQPAHSATVPRPTPTTRMTLPGKCVSLLWICTLSADLVSYVRRSCLINGCYSRWDPIPQRLVVGSFIAFA